jgi:hypothetical protein
MGPPQWPPPGYARVGWRTGKSRLCSASFQARDRPRESHLGGRGPFPNSDALGKEAQSPSQGKLPQSLRIRFERLGRGHRPASSKLRQLYNTL